MRKSGVERDKEREETRRRQKKGRKKEGMREREQKEKHRERGEDDETKKKRKNEGARERRRHDEYKGCLRRFRGPAVLTLSGPVRHQSSDLGVRAVPKSPHTSGALLSFSSVTTQTPLPSNAKHKWNSFY
ncbi:hypothetical protein WMY93_000050 [Mugilogobius chulae]|uniref:Uncharacterized protein n=1 Tax=Mugilogobius chulae TaxID=88201 RepID=A0AAW0Q8Y1_9GOBI